MSSPLVTYHHEVASIPLGEVSRESQPVPRMSCTPLPKTAKLDCAANQLIRLPCLAVCAKGRSLVKKMVLRSRW